MTSRSQLNDSRTWNELLVEEDGSRQADLCRLLAGTLGSEDVSHLITLLKHDMAEVTQLAALKVLIATARNRPQLLNEKSQAEILSGLKPLLASYPKSPGESAFYLLRLVDSVKAEAFLIREVNVTELAHQELTTFIANLSLLPSSSRIEAVLRELAKRPGGAGHDAQRRLENMGYVSDDKIAVLAKEWRDTHAREPLNRLFEAFISHQGDKAIKPVLELLGPPSERKDKRYFYRTADGLTLYLEQDDKARLVAMKIK
jgi:hypothetical protein